MADTLDLRRIDPQWRCFFEDGSVLDLHEDVPTMQAVVEGLRAGQRGGYRDFIGHESRTCTGSAENFFFWRSVEDIRDTLDFKKPTSISPRCGT